MTTAISPSSANEAQAIFAHPLVRALDKPIKPPRVGIFYRIGLLLILVMMLLLPMVYVGLIGAVGYLVYLHAVNDTFIIGGTGRVALVRLFVYLAPIAAGSILVLFMIKPLFSRRREFSAPLTVSEKDQPLLHAFVRKLADVVHAPRPCRIDIDCDVNASASFKSGFIGLLRQDLVLTIGLPLVSGLNAQQFTSVLAHELGHFAQGGAMRLTYLIRRLNAWFARIVYERDSLDEGLHQALHGQSQWMIQLVALLAIYFVAISRLILKFMMMIAHGVSSFMLRQMEFDADRCAARVAGSEGAIQTTTRLPLIQLATQAAFSDLSSAWREKRLADDLPMLIRAREKEMPNDVRSAIATSSLSGKTRWFDSHPSDKDRIASMKRENAAGLFNHDVPAIEMFKDYDDLSRRATVAFYHSKLGGVVQPSNLVPTSSLVELHEKVRESHGALDRFFLDLFRPVRAIFLDRAPKPVADPAAAAEQILMLRSEFSAKLQSAQAAASAFDEADNGLIALMQYTALSNAGIKNLNLAEFKLPISDETEIPALLQKLQLQRDKAWEVLSGVLALATQRLELALSLNCQPPTETGQETGSPVEDFGEYDLREEAPSDSSDGLANTLVAMRGVSLHVEYLRRDYLVFGALLSRCKSEKNPPLLIEGVMSASRKTIEKITLVSKGLHGFKYPYAKDKPMPLSEYLVKGIPTSQQVINVYETAKSLLDGFYTLYTRIVSDLCHQAEQVEASLGLQPLELPESGASAVKSAN